MLAGRHLPLHAIDPGLLGPVLGAAGVASAVVVALALAAFARRRSWSYLLVTLALGTLLVRTALGALTAGDVLAPGTHHVLEHGLDAGAVVLLAAAVYLARTAAPRRGGLDE